MQKLIAAALLCVATWTAAATEGGAPAEPAPPAATADPSSAPPPAADQAAMEAHEPHSGPTFGKSRVERRRDKCQAQAREQGLKDAALEQHLRSCVKR